MNETYRPSRAFRCRVLANLAILLGVLAVVPLAAADVPAGSKVPAVLAMFGIVVFFTGLCFWGLLSVLKHKLVLTDQAVETTNLSGIRHAGFDAVREARWGCSGESRTLCLVTPAGRLKIELACYDRQARRELIRRLRLRIPEAVQRNWDRFWAASWRLFDEPRPADREWLVETAGLRTRLCLVYYGSAVVLVPLGVAVWSWTRQPWVLAILAFLLPVAPVCHLAKAQRGKVARKHRPRMNPVIGLAILIVAYSAMACGVSAAFDLAATGVICAASLALSLGFLGWGVVWQVLRWVRWNREAARLAEREYLREPDSGPPRQRAPWRHGA